MKRIVILLAVLLISISWSVTGSPTSYLFTTTADFDLGDKTIGPIWFANNGVDQPTYDFINQPQAVYSALHRRTYIVYFGDSNGSIYVTFYNHVTKLWHPNPKWLFSTNATDGHNNAAIWPASNGKIMVVGGGHDTDMRSFRTLTTNGNIDAWQELVVVDPLTTYPTIFEYPSGTIWTFYRSGSFNPISYRTSTNFGTSWSAKFNFIDMAPEGVYIGKWDIVGTRLYVPWTMRNSSASPIGNTDIYVCYFDLPTRIAYSLAGVNLGSTITKTEADTNCRVVHQTQNGRNNQPALDVIGSEVFLLYPESSFPNDPEDWHLNYTRWNGAWSSPVVVADPIGESSSFFDLLMASPNSGEAFVTTIGVTTGCTGDCLYTGDIERYTFDGNWSFAEVVLSQTKAGDTVNHPYYVWNGLPELRVIFDQFINVGPFALEGSDRKIGDQKLYAWGSGGFVTRRDLDDGLVGVATLTDTKYATTNAFVLTSPRNDPFTHPDGDAENWNWRYLETEDGINDCVKEIDGAFIANWTSGGGSGRRACGLRGQFNISGDFDIRIRMNATDCPSGGVMVANFNVVTVPFGKIWAVPSTAPTANGAYMQKYFCGVDLIDTVLLTAGSITPVGSSTVNTDNSLCLRMARSGTTWTSYFSAGCSSWTTDETFTGNGGVVWITFGIAWNSVFSGQQEARFDDFDLATGTLLTGVRTFGSWASPEVTYAGETVRNITVIFTGASAVTYIDSVSVVDAATRLPIWENTTDVIAGSSVFYEVGGTYEIDTALHNHDFRVVITLAGDGVSSMTVTEVRFSTATPEFVRVIEQAIDIFWLIIFISILVTVVVVAWRVKEWRGV